MSDCGHKPAHRQRGIALLVFVILISMVSITVYFNSISVAGLERDDSRDRSVILADAKRMLLAYASLHADVDDNGDSIVDFPGEFGFLPCPDYNGGLPEGLEDNGNCGSRNVSKLGYLPWRTLGMYVTKTNGGDCLWYAVSGAYKNDESGTPSKKTLMLNEDTNGQFRIYDADGNLAVGGQPDERAVAVIIDPREPVLSQSRNYDPVTVCGKDFDATQFLEGDGSRVNSVLTGIADSLDEFIRADGRSEKKRPQYDNLAPFDALPPFNDRIEYITREELWQAVLSQNDFSDKMQNLTAALAGCLSNYANVTTAPNRRLPWPAPYDFSGADYRENTSYTDVNTIGFYAGRIPYSVNDSNTAMSIAAVDELFDIPGLCNSVAVPNPPAVVDLSDPAGEYRILWQHWKDHFFYALSKPYEPGTGGETSCGAADCFTVSSTAYAGVVIYSGSRRVGQLRSAPPLGGDPDNKADVSNYLEQNRAGFFPSGTGNGAIDPVNAADSNDYMYCITNEMPGAGNLLTAAPC